MALVVGTNSYAARAEADTYFADSLKNDEWRDFTGKQRDAGMIEVTRILERQKWLGEKATPEQVLAFGRTGLTYQGVAITAEESLAIMKTAQFEYAYAVLKDNKLLATKDATGSNIKSVKGGSAKVDFFRASKGGKYPIVVSEITKEFMGGSGSVKGSLVSGNCDATSFEEDQYDKTQGYY